RYRVIQQALDAVDLEWVADDLPAEADSVAERLGQELGDLLGVAPLVDLRPVRYIPPEKSNKYRLIFSRLPSGAARREASPSAAESCP
ncbi:MAG: hypothetical protein J5I93_26450, partial [Pirellulaceae bacterium]|nr:hypothetical protein [Pirellulaceae bacterium]